MRLIASKRLVRAVVALAGLLAAVGAHAAADKNGGVAALRAFYANVHTLQTTFTQVQTDESGGTIQETAGSFVLDRPDKFRWEYTKPYRQIIVSNGKTFRFYDVDLAQLTVRDVGATLRATPAHLLTGNAVLEDAFKVAEGGSHDGLVWVNLTPRSDSSDFREIKIGLNGKIPAAMELDDKLGQTTRIDFHNIKVNQPIAKGRFQLQIPKGVTVVDGRADANRR